MLPAPKGKKYVIKTCTRTCYLADMKVGETGQSLREFIEDDVAAVSTAMRNGSRFFELQLRLLLKDRKFPDDFDWRTASRHACAAMQKNPTRKQSPGYAETDRHWQTIHSRQKHGVQVFTCNSLTYATDAYYNTLLCNYTKVALPTHVFWTLRYLFPQHRQALKLAVIGHQPLSVEVTSDKRWSATFEKLIARCHLIQDAKFSPEMATMALRVRWACLHHIDALAEEVRAGKREHKATSKRGEVYDVLPKRFALVPLCRKAARFITLDEHWARKAFGLVRDPKEDEALPATSYLQQLFMQLPAVKKWMKTTVGKRVGFPATVKTDGVQLQIPFEQNVLVPKTESKKAAANKDRKLDDPVEFDRQLTLPNPRGLYLLAAARNRTTPYDNAVGVDPGIRNLIATSDNKKLTRNDFYGWHPKASTFDGTKVRATAKHKGLKHSRQTRKCAVPAPIRELQDGLTTKSLHDAGTCYDAFVANLTAWLTCAEELRLYYGSRTQRSVRLTRAANSRESMDNIVNLVAPDPKTVVVFGANFFGRTCRKGDVAGPVVVKGIRRKLAKHRLVIVADEFNTTKCHLVCGQVMSTDPADRHEKVCAHCGNKRVDRDLNAAQNIRLVWTEYLKTKTRPVHLSRVAVDDAE